MCVLTKKFKNAHKQFILHFGYYPNHPDEIDFDQSAYADILIKSVEDDVDYTVEKYGTKVLKEEPLPEIIYD